MHLTSYLALTALLAAPLHAQAQTWHYTSSFESTFTIDTNGASLVSLGDVDGDGYDDFVTGAPTAVQLPATQVGGVYAYSGASGKLLWEVQGVFTNGRFGESLAAVGDLDGDSIQDLLVGAPKAGNLVTTGPGTATIYSGATGQQIRSHVGLSNLDRFGSAVAGIGDVNGDNVPEYLVGAQGRDTGLLLDNGVVSLFDGASGLVLYAVDGTTDYAHFGASLAVLGDINNDNISDWIGGAPEAGILGVGGDVGYARVVSGANGAQLYFLQGSLSGDKFGFAVSGISDLNSDGTADFLVSAPFSATAAGLGNRGSVFGYSGATGALIRRLDGASIAGRYGSFVAAVADRTGDGIAEIAIGAPGLGRCEIRSGSNNLLVQSISGPVGSADFGSAGMADADLDGDGRPELLVSATGETFANGPGVISIFRNLDLPEDFHWARNANNSTWYGRVARVDWNDAVIAANLHFDVELVTIRNMAEQDFLWSTMLSGEGIAYTGLTDEVQEGNFVWRSGETTPWWAANGHFGVGNVPGNWYFQEPNNLNNEDYVTIGRPGVPVQTGEWNDAAGTTPRDALYEWTAPIVIQFSYAGSCPGSGTAICTGLTANSNAAVVYGSSGSSTVAAGSCGSLQIGLVNPTLLFVTASSGAGVIQFNASLPAGACGNIDAVVLDLGSCQLSNILAL